MIFLIAGISPKTKIIDEKPGRCPVCGLYQAYQKRIDHYLSIFFIPVIRVKKGQPFTICERCHRTQDEFRRDQSPFQEETGRLCRFCENPIHKGFFYCPYCGKKL
ncbi:MAG: zinc ribbon domain-containing protein [Deltaproteobacteria bacterium]|nr:zinc ribbon domain-containing protein [Deltaproteobacteria bacterium]